MDEKKLNPEIEAILEKDKQNREKLAEVYSQCWDDDAFKARFKAEPKAVMEEYGVEFDPEKEFTVIECSERTITFILPFENIKTTMEQIGEVFKATVQDVVEFKQIIPEGWNLSFIQNTQDMNYLVLPVSPENLTPEELEYVSGGSFFLVNDIFIYAVTAIALAAALVAAVAVLVTAAAVAITGVAVVAVAVAMAVAVIP